MTNSDDDMLTPGQVCRVLNVSNTTLARWRETRPNDLPYFRLDGVIRYEQRDVMAFKNKFKTTNSHLS